MPAETAQQPKVTGGAKPRRTQRRKLRRASLKPVAHWSRKARRNAIADRKPNALAAQTLARISSGELAKCLAKWALEKAKPGNWRPLSQPDECKSLSLDGCEVTAGFKVCANGCFVSASCRLLLREKIACVVHSA